MKETERTLKALANSRRLAIVRYLNKTGGANVGDIADQIKLSFRATSKHLGVLRSADLLEREQINLSMRYTLVKPLGPILKTLLSIV